MKQMSTSPFDLTKFISAICAIVALANCAGPSPEDPKDTETNMTPGLYSEYLQPKQEMTMRDGVTLRGDVFIPTGVSKSPAILIRTPYNMERYRVSDYTQFLLDAGYIVVAQDLRGRFSSDGVFIPGEHLLPSGTADAYDTIEWITQQEWSDGTVGMFGASYEASTQWGAAMSFHPALKAIAPNVGGSGPFYEMAVFGGPPYHAFLTYWTLFMADDIVLKAESEGVDASAYRAHIIPGYKTLGRDTEGRF